MGELIRAEMQTVVQGFAPLIRNMDAAMAEADEWTQIVCDLELREHLTAIMQQAPVRALFHRIGISGMVELANNPSTDDIAGVVGEGIMKGLNPRHGEFGIFGGRNGAKLYIKEAGYRRMINRLPGFSDADARVSFPIMQKLKNGASVWAMDGYASCNRNGKLVDVTLEGKFAVLLPAHNTDQIDAIKAKGRRRMLQALLVKCTGIIISDDGEDDTQPVAAGVQVIESVAVQPEAARDSDPDGYWRDAAQDMRDRAGNESGEEMLTWFELLKQCQTDADLRRDWSACNAAMKETGMDEASKAFLVRWKDHLKTIVTKG